MRWTDAKIARLSQPGMYNLAGGLGLYVSITGAGGRSYIARYRRHGRRHEIGLGPTKAITLTEATQAALNVRKLLSEGKDPLAMRRQAQAEARLAELKLVPWRECVEKFLDEKAKSWVSGTKARWEKRMQTHAEPILGKLPVSAVDDQLVQRVLSPIWSVRTQTAVKVRQGLEAVINFAVVSGLRPSGPNPARWKDHLDRVFASPEEIKPVQHQTALPYTEAPAFFALLKEQSSEVAPALRMIMLAGGRKMEILRARWSEFDLKRGMWNVPTENLKQRRQMKGRRKGHNVPLSSGMLEVLDEQRQRCGGHPLPTNLVFPSCRPGDKLQKVLSEPATQELTKRLGYAGRATVHGFRSSLEDFIAENIIISSDARKLMIGHAIPGGNVDEAYMRSDLTQQRRQGFEAWSAWLNGRPVDPAIVLKDSVAARHVG
jgi:integrase